MYSILLVEDNPMDVDLACRALSRGQPPVSVEVARDGEDALAFLARWEAGQQPQPSAILLDLKLPKVSGLEVLQRFKSHPRFSIIPVIVLTTSHEAHDLQTAYRLGANSYILKPIDYDRFLQVADQIRNYWCVLNVLPD